MGFYRIKTAGREKQEQYMCFAERARERRKVSVGRSVNEYGALSAHRSGQGQTAETPVMGRNFKSDKERHNSNIILGQSIAINHFETRLN